MRNLLILICLGLLAPCYMFGQESPKGEVFGGYSYFRAKDFPSNDITDPFLNPHLNLHGWNASVAANFNRWLGVEGDISGHYGSPSVAGFGVPGVDNKLILFMGGPKLSYRSAGDVFTPFAHFLIGAAHSTTSSFGFSANQTALAAAIGGGIDIGLSRGLAVRAVQADYVMTRFDNFAFTGQQRQDNLRLSFGVVLRF